MLKKRTVTVLAIFLLLAAAGTALCCVQLFSSPGVYKLGKAVHYEVFDSAYIIGIDGKKTNLTFCGTYDGKPYAWGCGSFYGAIQVAGYPVSYDSAVGYAANDGRGILFTRHGDYITANYYAAAMNEDGYLVPSGYQYTVILNPDAPEEIIIVIRDEKNQPAAIVVNGSSLEVSEQIYHDYIEADK